MNRVYIDIDESGKTVVSVTLHDEPKTLAVAIEEAKRVLEIWIIRNIKQ